LELRGEFRQFPERDSLSNLAHNVKEKCNVVVGVQDGGQDFVGVKQVPQVRARVGAADHAGATFIQRARIVGINRIPDVHAAGAGEEAAVPRVARRQDAIHHVYAAADVVGKLLGGEIG